MPDPASEPTTPPDPQAVYQALQQVTDPELHRDLVTLGRVRHVHIEPDGRAQIGIRLDALTGPIRAMIKEDIEAALAGVPGVRATPCRM